MIIRHYAAFPFGGAGFAALRHHRELRRLGLESRFYHRSELEREVTEEGVRAVAWGETAPAAGSWARRRERHRTRTICRQYDRHLRGRPPHAESFSQCELLAATPADGLQSGRDLVHLHWVAHLIDYPSFFASLPRGVPIVWTLHDMNPFTGGCHYSGDCARYRLGCGECPQVIDPTRRDVSWRTARVKRAALAGVDLHVVAPSEWLLNAARESPIWPKSTRFYRIAYGIDLTAFRPQPRMTLRQKLGIGNEAAVIAFGADDLGNPRKGWPQLREALARIGRHREVECLVFGRGDPAGDFGPRVRLHRLGYLDGAGRLAEAYSAADLLVLPSLDDNLPQTACEAMACGTPVVGFDCGGVSDLVHPGETGLLAPAGNVAALARQVGDLLEHRRLRQRLAAGARRLMEHEFELRRQTLRYVQLYRKLLPSQADRSGSLPHAA